MWNKDPGVLVFGEFIHTALGRAVERPLDISLGICGVETALLGQLKPLLGYGR